MNNNNGQKRVSNLFANIHGLGDFGFQLMVNMELIFFMAFLTDAVKFSPQTAGLIGSVTGFFDLAWVFVAGALVQKFHFKWGKLRSWLLLTPVFIWAFFIFQFWGFSGNTSTASFLICMGFIGSHLLWNCCYTAHIAMISGYTDDIQQRTLMSSRRMVYQALGKILFSLVAVKLVAAFSASTGGGAQSYTYTAMILTLVMIVGYFTIFVFSKPYESAKAKDGASDAAAAKAEKTPLLKSIANALTNSQLLILMITDFGRCFAFYLVTSMTAYYFRVVIGNPAAMTNYLLLINIAAAVFAFVAPVIAKAIGKKNTYFLGMAGYAAGLLLVYFVGTSLTSFTVLMLLASGFIQLSFSMGTAMFADTVVFGEWKTGVNARGFIMGLYSAPIKLGVLTRAAFMGAMLAAMKYVPDAVTPDMVNGIRGLISIYPALAVLACAVFGYIFYRLTDKRVKELSDEITTRK